MNLLAAAFGACLGWALLLRMWRERTRWPCACGVESCRGCCVSLHGDACPGGHEPVPSWTWTPW